MEKFRKSGRARVGVFAAMAIAVGAFASLGATGYAARIVGFAHTSPVAAQYPPAKVTICHHTHSQTNPFVTITVSVHALPAHLQHGDTIGPCAQQAASPAAPAVAVKQHKLHKTHKAKNNALKSQLRGHGKAAKTKTAKKSNRGHSQATTTATTTVKVRGQGQTKTHGSAQAAHGQGNGHAKTHGQSDQTKTHGQGNGHSQTHGQGNGHGQGQGHGQGSGDTHGGNSGGGKGNGH
jgi:hypothetical protein